MKKVLLFGVMILILSGSFSSPQLFLWRPLFRDLRITQYGPSYRGGEITASMTAYQPDLPLVALGPVYLQAVREHYEIEAQRAGRPLRWWGRPGSTLGYEAPWLMFPVFACYDCEPEWWNQPVLICRDEVPPVEEEALAGYALPPAVCILVRLRDTGSESLEVDLADQVWDQFGFPKSRGVFKGSLYVLTR